MEIVRMSKKFNPLKASYDSKAYKFWIKEREEEIKCIKAEIKIFQGWYKTMLNHEKKLSNKKRGKYG
jgi:hypothetical protein